MCALRVMADHSQRVDETINIERFLKDDGVGQSGGRVGGDRGQCHNRDVRNPRIRELGTAERPPVHDGHHRIEHDGVGDVAVLQKRERIRAVRRRHDVKPRLLQELAQAHARGIAVLDDEHPALHASRLGQEPHQS